MKTVAQKREALPTPASTNAPLSPQWAFVVQFRANPAGPVQEAGRIEHLPSGRSTRFASLQELVAYLAQELRHANDTS